MTHPHGAPHLAAGCLVIVAGLPGSGKTTEAKRLERERPGVRFCPDEWMTSLNVNLWDNETRGRIESLQWGMATQVLRTGGTAIIEWGTWGRDERTRLRTEARDLGARTELLYLDLPVAELWRRIANRGMEDPAMTRAELDEMYAIFEQQRPDDSEWTGYDRIISIPRSDGS